MAIIDSYSIFKIADRETLANIEILKAWSKERVLTFKHVNDEYRPVLPFL